MTWPDVRQAARELPYFRVIFWGNFSGLVGVKVNVISTGPVMSDIMIGNTYEVKV